MSRAAVGCPGEVIRRRFPPRHDGDGFMTAAIALPSNTASTFLTHFFGSGLADERYVVERFKALACGDIRRVAGEEPAATKKGRRRARRAADRARHHRRTAERVAAGMCPKCGKRPPAPERSQRW